MQSIVSKTLQQGLFILLVSALSGCSSASSEMAGGNLQAVNHTVHGINWMSVNGYRADGGGGASCCIIMPTTWRPGLKAQIEWEVDPEPFAKMPSVTSNEFREVYAIHAANYQRHSTTVDIPEWPGTERCGLKVHFLVCDQIKVTSSCWAFNSEHYPIKEPSQMKEPAVCPK
ncbi:DUF3304 domain-containing protein [Pseudomonas syringae pv. actinidiae]|uniref:DUF3304 domain-containing protein n=1 Tax=Pseudomonas syringae TaxID=317 RepID=UPI000BB5774D|nr:DUF3304 domain-containing protein [Pseudomonas syringae]PBK54464.1 hypothetical protein BUE60_09850 [Pseudomonas syringae pv. actinidiae]RJX58193.1 DUF3304 domain-containing protein [Pseudomonas syringae pv. actinidiae]RJX60289.1 DUF3304 domain-containing protein [Pseudomonas syringae pv. actinidiae]RJX61041.1 DUF3304 domain-containing protein [Pseudomonas syringae pv. actinidiae]RJY21886.1 DUF3304 domain-containing protein [Pseudomonas syringae pv. actinidiae]